MNTSLRITGYTFVLYALTLVVGITATFRHAIMPQAGAVTPVDATLTNLVVFLIVYAVFTGLILRFRRLASLTLNVFLALALVGGTQFILSAWWPAGISMAAAVVLLAAVWILPVVLLHDVAIVLGIAGVGGVVGLSIDPLMASVLLAVLALYDIYSVYRSRSMVGLAQRMMDSGAVFGFLVPASVAGFFMSTRRALAARQVMMLGSGDIGLPLVLAASAVSTSIGAAVMVAAFSLAGVMLMNWLFMHQHRPAPMAALPPIAASAILGFVLATLLHL